MSEMQGDEDQFSVDKMQVTQYRWHDIYERFHPLVSPFKWKIIFSMICVALAGIAVALMPLFPKYVIDTAIPAKNMVLALAAAGIFVIVQFSRMGLWYIAMRGIYRVQQSVVFKLRALSFGHLQHLCLSFHSRFPSGFLYERVFGSSINALGLFIQTVMQTLSLHVTGLFFSIIVCFYFSWSLTLVIVFGAICYVFTAHKLAPRIYRRSEAAAQAQMRVTEIIMDRLHGYKTIQAYSMEDRVQNEFESQVWTAQERWIAGVIETMKFNFVTEGIGYWLTAFVVVGGAWQILHHGYQVGVLVAFIGYQASLIGIINALSNVYSQFTATRVAFDQLFTILDTRSDVPELPGAVMPDTEPETLEFRNVSFGYIAEKKVLKDVSFELHRNETVALVGRSGCGKTTITNMLMRFYDPSSGAILLDGKDIRELPLREYRMLFGVVLQDPYLFDMTIFDNLRLVNASATEEEMIDALRRAQAWEFVKDLPGQLHFRVGEGGSRLSGGQRQRLAIARCLLLPSRFVILDEATSALDPESEALIQQSFDALSRDRTVLVIAHRLNTLRNADRILVMDGGSVVESGTYEELVSREGGLFRRLNEIAVAGLHREERLAEAGFA